MREPFRVLTSRTVLASPATAAASAVAGRIADARALPPAAARPAMELAHV